MDELVIEPQAVLGEYQVDFLLTQTSPIFDVYEYPITLADGKQSPGYRDVKKQIIIECGG